MASRDAVRPAYKPETEKLQAMTSRSTMPWRGLLATIALLMPLASHACRCIPPSSAANYQPVDTAMLAKVTRVQEQGSGRQTKVVFDLQVLETFKAKSGPAPTRVYSGSPQFDPCAAHMLKGKTYLVTPARQYGDSVDGCDAWDVTMKGIPELIQELRLQRDTPAMPPPRARR